ncbi:type VII secretion protein EccE [Tsukamurella pseudospumae]|uniref:Type VII secretion system protein EccE domain-containing protein n=1 Tax=Tsukamurella pseudospumae TaxID=239498 RepID=A0A137ZMP4_9ACTN|nr:type VII secretion protein EccE [Tsukamurella pseudospumae]KXO99436.1 hypothetical protein AXK61_16435 [Tsukamurella pseudospumae]
MAENLDAAASAKPPSHPEIARRRRLLGLSVTLRRSLVWAISAAAFVVVFAGRWPHWAVAAVVVVAAVPAFVAFRGQGLTERVGARLRYLRRRRHGGQGLAGRVIDVEGCGVRRGDGFELVSAIELSADLAETRLRDGQAFAASTVPLDLLASMMTQYGLDVDIDVVSSGRRVPPGPAYRASYAQGVRFYSALAERSTWLVLRVNTRRNLAGIVRRGPSRVAGPKALMAATRRLEQRLQERRIRCRVLPGDELVTLGPVMNFGHDPLLGVERWTHVDHDEAHTTTYVVDPARTSTAKLDRWWSLDSESTSVVLRLRRSSPQAPAEISGLVRYETAVPIVDDLDDALTRWPGRQLALTRATLPGGGSSVVDLPSTPLAELGAVDIPFGPTGPVWGISGSDAIALPLYDASPVPETLQVEFATDLPTLQLVLLRSVGAGASVAVHTDRPAEWAALAQTLADPSRFRIADGEARRSPDITVFDGVDIDALPERTVLALRRTRTRPLGNNADLTVEQISPSKVAVRIGRREPFDVVFNPTEEELRYCATRAQPAPGRRGAQGRPEVSSANRVIRPAGPAPVRTMPAPPAAVPVAPQGVPDEPRRPGNDDRPAPSRRVGPGPDERAPAAQRQQGARRWVRGADDSDTGVPSRRPVVPENAPRWAARERDSSSDEPPTSR